MIECTCTHVSVFSSQTLQKRRRIVLILDDKVFTIAEYGFEFRIISPTHRGARLNSFPEVIKLLLSDQTITVPTYEYKRH
jgi:hypothetical protein